MNSDKQQTVLNQLQQEAVLAISESDLLERVVEVLGGAFEHFTWTGFYLVDGEHLQVGPYVGKPTPHTRIKIGEGICGAAAASAETVVVADVNSDNRYLTCSVETKSEIVVPLIDNGKVLGEIDIDSDQLSAFDEQDARFLEQVAAMVVQELKRFSTD